MYGRRAFDETKLPANREQTASVHEATAVRVDLVSRRGILFVMCTYMRVLERSRSALNEYYLHKSSMTSMFSGSNLRIGIEVDSPRSNLVVHLLIF